MDTWKQQGTLLTEQQPTMNPNAHKTVLYVDFYNIITGKYITREEYGYPWQILSNTNTLPIPQGYSVQYADYKLLKHENVLSPEIYDKLGLTSIRVDNDRIYLTCNVVPQACHIKLVTVNELGMVTDVHTFYGKVGSPFPFKKVMKEYTDKGKKGYDVQILHSSGTMLFTYKEQIIMVKDVPPSAKKNGYIIIHYLTEQDTSVGGQYSIREGNGTPFSIDDLDPTNHVPKGFDFIRWYNPNEVSTYNNDNNIVYMVLKAQPKAKPDICSIEVDYRDTEGNLLTDDTYKGLANSPFNVMWSIMTVLDSPIGALHGPDWNNPIPEDTVKYIENDVPIFEPNTQIITVVVDTPASTEQKDLPYNKAIAAPGSAYLVFVDEDTDPSFNPSTYSDTLSAKQQGQPRPVTDLITRTTTPQAFSDMNNIKYSDVIYNGSPINGDTEVYGPAPHWDPYFDNTQFTNEYIYNVDTSKPLRPIKQNGSNFLWISCYPAYVRGITFQFGTVNHFGEINEEITQAPGGHQAYYPKGWVIDQDPLTGNLSFTVPYNTSISAYALANTMFGGAKGQFKTTDGDDWQVENDRTITFKTPYSYQIDIKRLD